MMIIKAFWKKTSLVCITLFFLSSCDKWVNNVKLPDNTVDESQLNSLAMLGRIENGAFVNGPVIAGVWRAGASSASDLLVASAAIVDEIVPTAVPNSPFYKELDADRLSPDNTALFGVWSNVQNYRARAEAAIQNALSLFPSEEEGVKIKNAALLYARLHAGYAWMLMADYFSVSNSSHSVFADHREVSHFDAYAKAQAYWQDALPLANGYEQRLLHALLTKLGMHTGNYQLAVKHIGQAFTASENFSFLNTVGATSHPFFRALNLTSRDAAVAPALIAVLKTAGEKARIPVTKADKGHWSLVLFKERDPLVVSDFDEMQLIRAELVVRGLLTGNAVDLVNTVIQKYDPSGASNYAADRSLTLMDIVAVRRVFLSWRGTRIIDLRRFHLDGDLNPGFSKRQWQWIGVPEMETQN
ncbi:hypothetical protein ACL9RF_05975 [Sphingobacterium sp. Mn56C]|uniref:hypothetical protein n=1 Tax=Sphingobacterium sp. Mn56C TaxID=3395261 RepID=UPI003BC1331F